MELEELLGILESYINELKQETKEAAFKERGQRFERDLDKAEATYNKALQAHREGDIKKRDTLMGAGAKQETEARAKYAKKEALYRKAGITETMGEKARNSAFQDELERNSAHDNYMEALKMYNDKKDEVSRQRAEKARQEYVKKQEAFDKSSKNADVLMKTEDKLRQKSRLSEGIFLDGRPDAMDVFGPSVGQHIDKWIDKAKERVSKKKSKGEAKKDPKADRLASIQNAQKLKQDKETATREYGNSVKQYLKAGRVGGGLPSSPNQVKAKTQLDINRKKLEAATKAHDEAKRTHLERKRTGDFKKTFEELSNIVEEIGTSIGAMMGVQPINLAGKEMPSKQNNHKEKKADYRYKYRKSRSKSIVEGNNMNLDEIFEKLIQEGVSEEIAGRTCEIIEAELPSFIETAEDKQRKANNQKYMNNLKAKEARKEQDKKNVRNAVINLRRSVRGEKPLSENTVEDIMNMVEDLISTAKKTGDEKLVTKAREVRDNERKRHNAELFHKWMKGDSRYNNVDGRYETKNEKGERETRLNSHQYDKNGFKKYNDEKALVTKSIKRHNKKENKYKYE